MLVLQEEVRKIGATTQESKAFTLKRHTLNTLIAIRDVNGRITYKELHTLMMLLREVAGKAEQLKAIGEIINITHDVMNRDEGLPHWSKQLDQHIIALRLELVVELDKAFRPPAKKPARVA